MTLEYIATGDVWDGQPIDGVRHPRNIEQLWTETDLAAVGLRVRVVPAHVPTLTEARAQKLADAAAALERRIAIGMVDITTSAGTHTYGIDRGTQDNVQKALLGVLTGMTPNHRSWTPKSATSPISITHDDVRIIASVVGNRYDALVQAYLAHKAAILTGANLQAVLAYNVETGWPA